MVGQKFLNALRLGDPDGFLVRNIGMPPGWESQKDFWLEDVKVRQSVKRMDMCSGGTKEDVPQSDGRVRAW